MSSVNQLSFTSGELSQSIWGRTDLVKYATGLKICQNFIVRAHGGVENRPGSYFIAPAKYHDKKCRLIPFEFSSTQTYALEFGDRYIRFYTNGGQILKADDTVYEIASPYSEADLPLIKVVQSADLMTLCHPDHPPRTLGRYGHTDWRLNYFANRNGPFEEVNVNEGDTMTVSGETGQVTISSNYGHFTQDHVGTQLYVEQMNSQIPPWYANAVVSNKPNNPAGAKIKSNGKTYIAVGSYHGTNDQDWSTGGAAPNHEVGAELDGPQKYGGDGLGNFGILWQYLHSGFGIIQITGVSDRYTASGYVVSRIPENINSGTNKWAFAAWNKSAGYPRTAMYHQQRLVFAATRKQPQTLWMSKTGDFNNFGHAFPGRDDDSITMTIAARQLNEIRYLVPMNSLIALTSASEWVIGDSNASLSPSTVSAKIQGYRGSSHNEPLVIGNTSLFIQEKGSIVRDLAYRYEDDVYGGSDLSVMSNHLFDGYQITDWAYAQVPYSVCWSVRNDGVMLGLTYMREQDVWGWHRHVTDGKFESVCSISEGKEDRVYLCVNREINGQTQRYIEVMATRISEPVEHAFFVDCGLRYNGEAKQSFSGLAHLEGKTVSILADGNVHTPLLVKNGAITLEYPAKVINVGLPYVAEIETLDLNIPTQESIRDRKKSVSSISLYLYATRGGWVGEHKDKMTELKPRAVSDNYNRIEPFTGLSSCAIRSSWNVAGSVIVQQRDPLPISILNAIPNVTVGGA